MVKVNRPRGATLRQSYKKLTEANEANGGRLVITLDAETRAILDRIKAETGASFGEIIRRLIAAKGEKS